MGVSPWGADRSSAAPPPPAFPGDPAIAHNHVPPSRRPWPFRHRRRPPYPGRRVIRPGRVAGGLRQIVSAHDFGAGQKAGLARRDPVGGGLAPLPGKVRDAEAASRLGVLSSMAFDEIGETTTQRMSGIEIHDDTVATKWPAAGAAKPLVRRGALGVLTALAFLTAACGGGGG